MKKKLLTVSVIVICLAVLGTGTLAYFTDSEIAHNVITSGGVDIQLVEQMLAEDGVTKVPFEDQAGLMPGQTASKIVSVKNLEAEAWIRIKLEKTVTGANGQALDARHITMDISENWISDGEYYYYVNPVAAGTSTEPLFEEVMFDAENMGNDYAGSSVDISVYAQAVQTANNLPDDGTRVLTAANLSQIEGWPSPVEEALMSILN